MEEKSVNEKYVELKNMMKQKYDHQIRAIASANNVDLGIAFDMLEANFRYGEAKADYKYINEEEAQKEFDELRDISKEIAIDLGLKVD